jgi:hypothetical protein
MSDNVDLLIGYPDAGFKTMPGTAIAYTKVNEWAGETVHVKLYQQGKRFF